MRITPKPETLVPMHTGKLTTDEQDWFDNKLFTAKHNRRTVVPDGHPVQLDNWTESDFIGWMSEERFAGTRLNFFGELELTREWFRRQFEKQLEGAGDKFIQSLHTETDEEKRVHQLLGDYRFADWLGELLGGLTESYEEHRKQVTALRKFESRLLDWEKYRSKLLTLAEDLQNALGEVLAKLNSNRIHLEQQHWEMVRDFDWGPLLDGMERAHEEYRRAATDMEVNGLTYLGSESHPEGESNVRRSVDRIIRGPDRSAANFMDQARDMSQRFRLLKEADLHIFGNAGFGKTHLCCHVCQERLDRGLPALLILGAHFTTGEPLEKQLLSILDIPSAYSWHDFLQALDSVARVHRTRIPIMINGLNEAIVGGTFTSSWRLGLPGLTHEISESRFVVLVTTCRSSYQTQIWGDKQPGNLTYAEGFAPGETRDAVERYFSAYKIAADLTAAPLDHFRHPIYLRIFCEITNPKAEMPRRIYVGEWSLFETFEKYLERCNEAVCVRLGLRRGTPVVTTALDRLAMHLWANRTRRVPISLATVLIDGKAIDELHWEASKTRALECEGLLVCRDWGTSGEELFFTYDLLGGYLIARSLIGQHGNDLIGFFQAESTVETLYAKNHSKLHPMHEDIGRAIAALLPSLTGQYLHELTDNKLAFNYAAHALFEIAPQDVNEKCVGLVTQLFGKQENRNRLFKLAESTVAHVNHPLNAKFWHERLQELPMAERDVSWTEYVRQYAEDFEGLVSEFEERFRSTAKISPEEDTRLLLLARHLMWLLTSTVRTLRDKATRALYWYGRRKPREFFDLLKESLALNDPYVSERMLAAAYGVAMARQHDLTDKSFSEGKLPRWARALFDLIFASPAPHATTHMLARDYARRTIEIALIHHSELLNDEERSRIVPPYEMEWVREWRESEDRDKGKYKEGNAPLGMDFENYTLGRLVEDRRNYNYEHEGFKRVRANVLWRIYDLGYSLERFGEIDQWIARGNSFRDYNPDKTDRYGKKYSWIAFFELAGHLEDQGLLTRSYDAERISDADIDPSFPEKMPGHKQVYDNFLGTDETSTQEWIVDGGVPDVSPYLIVHNLMDDPGDWVLIDAHIDQESKELDRNRFIFIRGLIIKADGAEEIIELLRKQDMKNRWLPEVPESHYLYAGEIPWCDTFPENEWEDLDFTSEAEEEDKASDINHSYIESEGNASDSMGELADENEAFEEDDYEYGAEEKRRARFVGVSARTQDDTAEERVIIIIYDQPGADEAELQATLSRAEEIIAEGGREAFETIIRRYSPDAKLIWSTNRLDQQGSSKYQALVPLREYSWELYHSALNQAGGAEVLAKQVAEAICLHSQPQTFDLFSADGSRASIAWQSGDTGRNSERFLYLRRDLLEQFLAKQNYKLVWVTWGERQHSIDMMSNLSPAYRPGRGEPPWRVFQQVITYDDFKGTHDL